MRGLPTLGYALILPVLYGVLFGVVVAQAHEPPTESSGLKADLLGTLPLGAQIPAMEGFQLRARKVQIAPGGVVAPT